MLVLVITIATVIGTVYGQSIITGSKYASVLQHPYQVSFQFSSGGHFCSGFLISPDMVVIAAHCVYNLNHAEIKTYKIRAGSSLFNKGGQLVQVLQAIVHTGFDELTNDHDIAILKLASAITDKNARPANLPRQDESIPDSYLNVTGWGTVKEGDPIPERLQIIRLQQISNDTCIKMYRTKKVTTNMFCTLSPNNASCTADCGDPAARGNTVYGIYSMGINCADPAHPSIFTRIPLYRKWISQNAGV